MTSGWFSRGRREESVTAQETQRAEMTRLFLILDTQLSTSETVITSANRLNRHPKIVDEYQVERTRVDTVINNYLLALNDSTATLELLSNIAAQLTRASAALDVFTDTHAATLSHATAEADSLFSDAVAAKAAAASTRQRVTELSPTVAAYPSITNGVAELDKALQLLSEAHYFPQLPQFSDAIKNLAKAEQQLRTAIEVAPQKISDATVALSSVQTRLQAAQTRQSRMAENFSALLQEFSAICSDDLLTNRTHSESSVAAAVNYLTDAKNQLPENPETTLQLIAKARKEIAAAEELVDAVTDRLQLLRTVAKDPKSFAAESRFCIRDAQLYAVGHNLVDTWGSVLDAQTLRVDRAQEILTGKYPNYFGYVTELNLVTEFVTDVVRKMKKLPPG